MFKMRVPVAIASALCSLALADPAFSSQPGPRPAASSRKLGLDIRVEGEGWGGADRAAIRAVLYSVADELMSRLPKKLNVPIVVTHTDSNPVALYERGPKGEYLVRLHAREESWHLYVYEFAHEFCHILSNYEENAGVGKERHNQWFEETLCETASLFTLKALASEWRQTPPLPAMAAHADKMQRFYDALIAEGHRRLPPHTPLGTWLAQHEEEMRSNPYLRQKNELLANLLLPLFEKNPEHWDALAYLNLDPSDARNSLQKYLDNWYRNAPDEHKTFIAGVLDLFRLGDAVPALASGTPATQMASTEGAAGKTEPVAEPGKSSELRAQSRDSKG